MKTWCTRLLHLLGGFSCRGLGTIAVGKGTALFFLCFNELGLVEILIP